MRLTRRGWVVIYTTAFTAAFTIGLLTADYCYWGACTP